MRTILFSTILALLLPLTPAAAQSWPIGPAPVFPTGMSRGEAERIAAYWVESYLRRRPGREEVRYWGDQLRRARTPADALAAFLSRPEYYDYAGSSRHGFIAQLIRDVGHHEPSPYEVRDWLYRTAGSSRAGVAYRFLREYPANWWPGPQATPPRELEDIYGYPPPYDRW